MVGLVHVGGLIPGAAAADAAAVLAGLGDEKPTRILSNTIGDPGAIEAHGSVAGPVTVTAMTSLTGFRPGSA